MTRAGTPATMLYGGTSFVTTAPAATMLCAPMVTPSQTDTWVPIQTSSSTTMPSSVRPCIQIGTSRRSKLWLNP
jgi:hypothetical protein